MPLDAGTLFPIFTVFSVDVNVNIAAVPLEVSTGFTVVPPLSGAGNGKSLSTLPCFPPPPGSALVCTCYPLCYGYHWNSNVKAANNFGIFFVLSTICHTCYYAGTNGVEIRRFSVPRWIENGTEDSVVLDCEYNYNENDIRLVVKWFFEENTEPVYQWIPELNRVHISGVLRGRLDRNFIVNTADAYSRFRALKIEKPSTELSGKYTCQVSSLAGQDSREQVMTVFVPANHFDLSYIETSYDVLNVSCEANGLFPVPQLTLYIRPSSGSPPKNVTDIRPVFKRRPNSAYDIYLHRTFIVSDLATNDGTVFECILEIPGTNYAKTKTVAYFPGIQRQREDLIYELESSSPPLMQLWIKMAAMCILIICLFLI